MMRVWRRIALLLVLAWQAAPAHEMTMAEMLLHQTGPAEFLWQWTATSDKRPVERDLTPVWPVGCTADDTVLRCGEHGLVGVLSIDGVGRRYSAALIKVEWLDGQTRVYTLTASQPRLQLYGSADDPRGFMDVARAYTVLGIQHILAGYDHLAFVLGLLFLVGFNRKLFWTITAFTVAHSLTLASAALGILTLRPPPVEATIALSIVLVAKEALDSRVTLARRLPAMLAFVFGLVHGLGFAGALKEIGLPQAHLPIALLTFNIGVELGQLFTVGLAYGIYRLLPRQAPWLPAARTATLYLIGSLAAFWTWERVATLLLSARV